MKLLACVVLLLGAACAVHASTDFDEFLTFVKRFNRTYASEEEFLQRYTNFQASQRLVQTLREQHRAATGQSGEDVYGVTKYSDWSAEEFKRLLGFKPSSASRNMSLFSPSRVHAEPPTSFDWRDKKAVSPVKDQGQCGSCWSFSTVEEIESQNFLATGTMEILSEEQIVDCDTVDQGCNGGDTISAYQYVEGAGGLETEAQYPYTAGGGDSGTCKFDKKDAKVTVESYSYATPGCTDSCDHQDEGTLVRNLVAGGPVSICVYAEPWQVYTGGVLSSGCPHDYSDLDHCVQLVGYNQESSEPIPYWIIRNSWGTDWGYDGYIYVKMGGNTCGVADEATLVKTKAV